MDRHSLTYLVQYLRRLKKTDYEEQKNVQKGYSMEISNVWIIPSNPQQYRLIDALRDSDVIEREQHNNHFKVGDIVYYDPEEERRIFYVAITRAKHKLDILQVDIYHDRHQKPSRFIGDLHATNQNVEVVSYSDSKARSMIRFNMPHYVIRHGQYAGIYNNEDEINEIRKKAYLQVAKLESYLLFHYQMQVDNKERLQIYAPYF